MFAPKLTDFDAEFAHDVRTGLTREPQKELPPRYFYDQVGSALFEVITLLPEYGLSRADARLLREHSPELAARLPGHLMVVELGSGSGAKTRWVLEALAHREPLRYYPIDISGSALSRCRQELEQIRGVDILELERSYIDGLREVTANRRPGQHLLVLFLGSTIGNFDRTASDRFLIEIRRHLVPGDALLLGADLVKPVVKMLRAYDDSLGVTAAFNLNLLARINRELDGDFRLQNFRHEARYDKNSQRIEMHLRSLQAQRVTIRAVNLTVPFRKDETIWTESCHKFRAKGIRYMVERAGFVCQAQWIDRAWPFAETLFIARR